MRTMGRVIAVDGPAGAGKSTACRALAAELGFRYLDTGAMYRIVGVVAEERQVPFDDDAALERLVADLGFDMDGDGVRVEGGPAEAAIRSARAGDLASRVSTRAPVRRRLVAEQRRLGARDDVVMEGRDVGTVVFPDAPLKIFLTADPTERARRRAQELAARGETVDVAALARDLAARDERDASRADSPLRPAPDARRLDTTTMSLEEVVAAMARLAHTVFRIPART